MRRPSDKNSRRFERNMANDFTIESSVKLAKVVWT